MKAQVLRPAYNYVRFSTPEQAHGDSYRRQTDDAAKWARDNGYQIVETLQDRGVSAFDGDNAERGSLAEFGRRVDQGKIPQGAVLIVEDLDRLSREAPWIALGRFFGLIGKGIGIVNLVDRQVYTAESLNEDATGSTLFGPIVNMARGHNESVQKRNRGGKKWAEKREQARLRPDEPDAKLTSLVPGWLTVRRKGRGRYFAVDKTKRDIVRRIFAETVQGFGRRMIAKRLNRDRKPAFRTKYWQPSTINKILRGKAVLGEFQPHVRPRKKRRVSDGLKPIAGYYPPIIDEALWHAANAKITQRRRNSGGRPGAGMPNLIPGIARCSCGKRMVLLNKGKPPKGGRYYVCGAAVRSAGCKNGRHWNAGQVERALVHQIDPKPILLIGTLVQPDGKAPLPEDIDVQIGELKRRRGKLIENFGAADDDEIDEQAKAQIDSLLADIRALGKKREEAEAAAHTPPPLMVVRSALEELAALTEKLDNAGDDERTELRYAISQRLRAVFHEIEFRPNEIVGLIPLPGKPARIDSRVGLAGLPKPITARMYEDKEKYFLRHTLFSDDPDVMALMADADGPPPKAIINSRPSGAG